MGMTVAAFSSNDVAVEWVEAHAALSRLARERAALDAEEGRWLLRAWRSQAHVHLGYGAFAQYIEQLFGYKPRTIQEKLRVAEALEGLPRLAHSLEDGALGWCAARELTRVAVPETESAWLDAARGKTLRELEALVAQKAPGDAPDAPDTQLPRPRVLRFEVAADTFAIFREAMQQVRRSAGGSLNDDAVLLALARHVLGGPRDDGRSSYQVSLSVCSACGAGAQTGAGELVPVDPAVVAMATCDAQHLGKLLPRPEAPRAANQNAHRDADATGAAESDERAAPVEPTGVETTSSRCSGHAHVGVGAPDRRTSHVASAAALPDSAAGAQLLRNREGQSQSRPSPRARQSIPPALRRAVLTRDHRRCRVPGCAHATFVDVHHVTPRSEGGRHEASNLLVICSAHHRATHRGELLIERNPEGCFIFRHADGTTYGQPTAPHVIDVHAKVFSALRNLGFREGEVKAVLSELRGEAELHGESAARLLREALCRIKRASR